MFQEFSYYNTYETKSQKTNFDEICKSVRIWPIQAWWKNIIDIDKLYWNADFALSVSTEMFVVSTGILCNLLIFSANQVDDTLMRKIRKYRRKM